MNYVPAKINDKYDIVLPEFRAEFHAKRPNWEVGRLDACYKAMEPGMQVWDIGAEHGDFTALYKKWVGEKGTVIPIEPAAHYWPFIRKTWEANGFSQPPRYWYEGLIADVSTRPFHSVLSTWPKSAYREGIPDGGFIHLAQDHKAPRTTIDLIAAVYAPDAIVMDIEGAEFSALLGGRLTLEKYRPLVWVSVHEETMLNWYGHTLHDVLAYMDQLGYDAMKLPHHGEGEDFWEFLPI